MAQSKEALNQKYFATACANETFDQNAAINGDKKETVAKHADSLYEDKFCRVTKENIIINCYYFPTGKKKTVRLDTVDTVCYESQMKSNFLGAKGWGMALSTVWWAKDMWRQFGGAGTNVVLTVAGSSIDKGFTVERFDDFLSVILPLLKSNVKVLNKIP